MKVKCIANTGAGVSETKRQKIGYFLTSITPMKVGDVYTVYGQVIWRGIVVYLLIGSEESLPSLYPAELFSVEDSLLPLEYYFHYWKDEEVSAVWGFQELAENPQFLFDLIDRKDYAIRTFLSRKSEIESNLGC